MTTLILRRLILAIPTLFIVVSLTFLLMRWAPGNPFSNERKIPPEILAELEKQYDLNGTVTSQYLRYMGKLVHGDLSISTQYRNRTVNDILAQALPVSVLLGGLAYLLALMIGIPLGAYAAVRQDQKADRLAMLAALLGLSVPSFVLAPLLVMLFGVKLHWLPVAGWGSPDQIILPVFCLAIPFAAAIARLTRGSLLDVLNLDFIRTARAKGLPEEEVLYRHALKIAILPLISYSGPALAGILTGSLVIETLFDIPGIGRFFINSVLNRDPMMSAGVILVFSAFLLFMNLVSDVLISLLDRRVKIE